MDYPSLVYSLLQSLAWSITPVLPSGSASTRLPVGTPEKIPDDTFVTRLVTPADGIDRGNSPTVKAECERLNKYIEGAMAYHKLFGLAPIEVGSVEQILDHFEKDMSPIGRIRFVTHGNAAFIWCPMFKNGRWDFGLSDDWLKSMQSSDEGGLRFLLGGPATGTIFHNIVDSLVVAVRAHDSTLLAPFGLDSAGAPTSPLLEYFESLSDLYQARHGTISISHGTGLPTAPNTEQTTIITEALRYIEEAVRRRVAVGTIADKQLTAFRDAVLPLLPGPLGMFGGPVNLPAGTVTAVAAATAGTPVEATLRAAFTRRTPDKPVFGLDVLTALVEGVSMFNRAALNIGPTPPLDAASIGGDADVNSLALTGVDLFMLQNGVVLQDGKVLTDTERTTLRLGLIALSTFPRDRIVRRSTPPPFTRTQLNTLRDAIGNIDFHRSAILNSRAVDESNLTDLRVGVVSMRANFRTKLDHFRSLMRPGDASALDVRGCRIGNVQSYLVTLRTFFGTATNQPKVSAPDWFQSFPTGVQWATEPSIATPITKLLASGIGNVIRAADVGSSFSTWRDLIDFDPHFDYIRNRFAAGASKRDFASLSWRVFRTSAAPQGIPVLRMAAKRIDDLDTLELGPVIERFMLIFEIPNTSAPDAATRTTLTALQPQVVRFTTLSDALAAASSPTDTQLARFVTDLTALVTSIAKVAPSGPTAPTAPTGSTPTEVNGYFAAVGGWIDALLDGALGTFFTAMQGATGATNAELHYFYNSGLPLLLRNDSKQLSFCISTFVSPVGTANDAHAGATLVGDALRSFMRIQWEGSAAMNAHITRLAIGTNAERAAAARVSMLVQDETATSATAIAPMPNFDHHIIKSLP